MSFIVQANSGNTIMINAEQDGALNDVIASGQDFVIAGIEDEYAATFSQGSLQVSVGKGEALIGGRTIRSNSSETITVPANATTYLVLRIDLTQTPGNEGMLYALTAENLIQKDNLNSGGSIHDLLLAIVDSDSSGVTSIVDRRTILSGLRGRQSTITIETTDWVAATYGVKATKVLTGVTAADKVKFSVQVDMTSASYQSMINARAFVQDVESSADQITVYATTAPTININLDVEY